MSVNAPAVSPRRGIANRLPSAYDLVFMKRLRLLLGVFALAPALLLAQGPDEQYVRIYQVIQEADRLSGTGQTRAAAAKYVEAREALIRFSAIFPGWNERVVNYRINYISTKLAPLSALAGTPGTTPPPNTNTAPSAPTPGTKVAVTAPPSTASPWSAEFDSQVKALQNEVTRLQSENKTLSAKLKEALSAQPATIDPSEMAKAEERIRSLQKENELFKAQLAQIAAAPPAASLELTAKLAEQNEAISALRTENEILKKQSVELRDKYAALSTSVETTRAQLNARAAESEAALRKASSENMGLQKELELWKQVAQDNIKKVAMASIPSMPPDAQQELLALRARVQSLEAQPVPYTAEELALFNKPASVMVANLATPASPATPPAVLPAEGALPKKVSRGVPPGAGALLRAAERAFATQQYAEAEKKYLEVLRQDENNVTTLGNLASAQVELGNYAEAEKNAQRALALDPNDYFSLYVLGRIRFRENKLDAALDALSRSAQANPNYADAQNYLGIVLSEKGQRGPAETALRRAIQLQPDNAVAHNNLAVVYATQKPPAAALARWHYQKARSSGHPANAELEKLLEQKQ